MIFQYIARLLADPMSAFRDPVILIIIAFALWMLVDAIRREEWFWAVFIVIFPMFNPILYFFLVYRQAPPLGGPKFELPGAGHRRRIKELQDQIHHLDKAHHHSQLADIYYAQGKLAEAEKEYLLALERDSEDEETIAHYGQCLLSLKRPQEARAALEKVVKQNPQHEYGATLMAYAETLGELGDADGAIAAWRQVLERNSYAQARVQLARLLIQKGENEAARRELQDVISDAGHTPAFQRKREKAWAREAERLLKAIG